MDKALTAAVWLSGAMFVVMGITATFAPATMAEASAVVPAGSHGWSTVRGDLGGMFLATAGMIGVGLRTRDTTWWLAVAVLMAGIAFGRFVGFLIDGIDAQTAPAFLVELVVVGVMVSAHRRQSATG